MAITLTDSALVAKLNAMDDHELVTLLKNGDEEARYYVELRAIFPMLKSPKLVRIAAFRALPMEAVSEAVFDFLFSSTGTRGQQRIDRFEFHCPFILWVRHWVSQIVLGTCGTFANPAPAEMVETLLTDKAMGECDRPSAEVAQQCFMRLWKENRVGAYVYYLRTVSSLTPREVMKLLHLPSEAMVDRILSCACTEINRFRTSLTHPATVTRSVSQNQETEALDELP